MVELTLLVQISSSTLFESKNDDILARLDNISAKKILTCQEDHLEYRFTSITINNAFHPKCILYLGIFTNTQNVRIVGASTFFIIQVIGRRSLKAAI